ncbi:MAG: DNA repair and recombination protein RadB [Candidatus Woesearchaeota archaeon]|nr:DNA repair and recombination protein RadB [Candidatus Woesearchaeota archaeon]
MKLSSGSKVIDSILNGGYQTQMINTIYGVAASGKTTACLLAAIECAKKGKKVIYVDTESGFPVDRLKQLTKDYEKVLDKIFLIKANSFKEQSKIFSRLKDLASNQRVGLLIVDTIGSNYRTGKQDLKLKNRLFGRQLDILRGIYKVNNCIILLTNPVYSSLEQNKVKPVGGKSLVNRSKCMIQLDYQDGKRTIYLRKHPDIKKTSVDFIITNNGFENI